MLPTPEERNAAYKANTSKNSPGGERSASARRDHRQAVDGGRQRQPRGRPGRPAGRPAADGGRLRGDRQRRQRRPPARRARASRTRGAASCRRSTRRRSATSTSTRVRARRSSTGSTRRRSRAGRDVLSGVRQLPGRRSPARPARPQRAGPGRTSPGTSRWRRIRRPQDRGRGDDRAGRVRRRLGGAGGAGDPRRLLHINACQGRTRRRLDRRERIE